MLVSLHSRMEAEVARAVDVILSRMMEAHSPANPQVLPGPFMVAVAGVPGSGKTTISRAIVSRLETLRHQVLREQTAETAGLQLGHAFSAPMDGYHHPRSYLRSLPNAELAFEKRGAPWTFDGKKLLKELAELKATGVKSLPGFNHSEKDPVEGAHPLSAASSIANGKMLVRNVVIVEGIYVNFSETPGDVWSQVANLFDLRIFVEIDLTVSTERLVKRHMRVWHQDRTEAEKRAKGSDFDNALLIDRCKHQAHLFLKSVDDDEFCQNYPLVH